MRPKRLYAAVRTLHLVGIRGGHRHLRIAFCLPLSFPFVPLDTLESNASAFGMLQTRRDILLAHDPRFGAERHRALMERLVKFPKGGNAWNADHVTAVYQVRSGAARCGAAFWTWPCVSLARRRILLSYVPRQLTIPYLWLETKCYLHVLYLPAFGSCLSMFACVSLGPAPPAEHHVNPLCSKC